MVQERGCGQHRNGDALVDVLNLTSRQHLQALPIGDSTTAWQTAAERQESALVKFKGEPAYKAYRGASTEPYGVFWLRLKGVRSDGILVVENLPELGKREIRKLENVPIEPDLVYPAVSGKDISRWRAHPNFYVLIVQDPETRLGYLKSQMIARRPQTYGYLKQFEVSLRNRAAFKKYFEPSDPFYTQFNVSSYSFAAYKVVWKRMASDLVASVMSTFPTPFGEKKGIATDTTSLVPFDNMDEAHYVCALLNSSPSKTFVRSFPSAGRGFGAPSIMSHMALSKYDSSSPLHCMLSSLSQQAHQLAALGKDRQTELRLVEEEIDHRAAEIWGLSEEELKDTQSPLREIV